MGLLLRKAKMAACNLLREDGPKSRPNDIAEHVIIGIICLNVALIIAESVGLNGRIGAMLGVLRTSFFVFFLIEYLLRVWISDFADGKERSPFMSRLKYIFSIRGVVDLLALTPVMLGGAIIDFRIFRILRLLRVARLKNLKRYTDVLVKVFKLKGPQLVASIIIVFIFILVSSVIIYDFECKAQPDVFNNILSGLWWSISAITTVGYGDMYPITPAGRIFASFMSIFGVFLMAVPIGILTSGFFEVSKNKADD